jgi:hypothetical protein
LAALAIAKRDPWPDVEVWLAANLDNRQTVALATGASDETATIGAMASAMLARRHGCRPASLGLVRTTDKQMEVFNLYGYRYGKPESIERVRQWWKVQSAAPYAPDNAGLK